MQCIYQDRHPCNMCACLLVKVNLQCNQSKCNNVSLSLFPSVHQAPDGLGVYFKHRGEQTEHAQMRGACKLGRAWGDKVTFGLPDSDSFARFLSFLCRFGYFPATADLLVYAFDDTDCNSLSHISDSKTSWENTETHISFKWKLLYKDLVFFLVCLWPDLRLKLNPSHLSEVCLTKTRFSLWTPVLMEILGGKIMRTRCNKNICRSETAGQKTRETIMKQA